MKTPQIFKNFDKQPDEIEAELSAAIADGRLDLIDVEDVSGYDELKVRPHNPDLDPSTLVTAEASAHVRAIVLEFYSEGEKVYEVTVMAKYCPWDDCNRELATYNGIIRGKLTVYTPKLIAVSKEAAVEVEGEDVDMGYALTRINSTSASSK